MRKRHSKCLRVLLLVPVVGVAMVVASASPAAANTPIISFTAVPSTAQAGGHPDVEIKFSVKNRVLQNSNSACDCEDVKDATVHLPTGFIGNPHATPQCNIAEFSAEECPFDSQVGIVNIGSTNGAPFNAALYNLQPPPNVAGLLGFRIILGSPQFTVLSARTGSDYGLDATATSIYHGAFPLETYQQVIWGVPADPSHNLLRINPAFNPNQKGGTAYFDTLCNADGSASTSDPLTVVKPCIQPLPPQVSNSPRVPFLQNPTTCDKQLTSSLDVLSYDGGTSHADQAWPQMTGCDQLSFNPSLYAQPTTSQTDSPSGIEVNLTVPQLLSPTIPSPTELRGATVTLPKGFSINPSAADGKLSCSDSAANFGTTLAAECPDFSKVGTLTIESSALPGPLPGYVYLGEPLPGERYRIFLAADAFATHIKLAGVVHADPVTGQLVVEFNELPESPLTTFNMHFFGSERGLLATPDECGTYPVSSSFTPWDDSLAAQTSTQFFTLTSGPHGSPCPNGPRPFNPSFEAASSNHSAGLHAPFSLELNRADGDQNLTGITVSTPPGFSATLAGIPYCSDAALSHAAAAGYSGIAEEELSSCPRASRIGTAVTAAGAGTHPVYVSGNVYLAGPYKGAPLSLAVITPAVSGPYDLGNIVERVALQVDPTDGRITAIADPLPQILEGIPLRLRRVRINLDRPEFTINPTNCDPFSVDATVSGDQGAVANLSEPFQIANCGTLPFGPKLAIRLSGNTKRVGDPALHSVLTAGIGESGISRVQVTLPPTEIVDNRHLGNPCTRVQFAAGACPASSQIGFAKAETPLLEKPLEGPVYLRTDPQNKSGLPDVVADLKGQIEIVLQGRISTANGGLRTTFEGVPDAPVSKFTLALDGGPKGLLQNTEPLCAGKLNATVRMSGQNGKATTTRSPVQLPCGRSQKRHREQIGSKRKGSQ